MEHTKLKVRDKIEINGFYAIVDEKTDGKMFYEESQRLETARRIVKCCNLHNELVEALKAQQKANKWFGPSDTGRKLRDEAQILLDNALAAAEEAK